MLMCVLVIVLVLLLVGYSIVRDYDGGVVVVGVGAGVYWVGVDGCTDGVGYVVCAWWVMMLCMMVSVCVSGM